MVCGCPTPTGILGPIMNKTIESLKEYLKSNGCVFDFDRKKETLHFGIDGKNARWRSMACADNAGRFVMVSLIPLQAVEHRRRACSELLTRINARIGLGHFDLDFNDGELRFLTSIPLGEKDRLSHEVIEHVIRGHHTLVDDFIPAIAAVLFAATSPEKAISLNAQPTPDRAEAGFSLN